MRANEKDIIDVLKYFNHFKYPASSDEIHLFLAKKISKPILLVQLRSLEDNGNIIRSDSRYALEGYGKTFKIWSDRKVISEIRIKNTEWFIKLLSKFSQIILVGVSGGLAMLNSDINDDIDLFVIARKNRIWTARMIVLFLSSIFGIRRSFKSKNVKDKLCFNLFFDESNLTIADFKKNRYIAHEIVQMKPLVIKYDSYNSFLKENNWVESFFPNLNVKKLNSTDKLFLVQSMVGLKQKQNLFGNLLEQMFRWIQLIIINRHKTNEIVSDSQLWFFPHDFQKNVKKLI